MRHSNGALSEMEIQILPLKTEIHGLELTENSIFFDIITLLKSAFEVRFFENQNLLTH